MLRLWESGKLLAVGCRGTRSWGQPFPCGCHCAARVAPSCPIVGTTSETGPPDFRQPMVSGRDGRSCPSVGHQHLPAAAWIDTDEQALALIGRVKAARRFDTLVASTQPEYSEWVASTLRLLDVGDDWQAVQAVATWLQSHPTPHIYVRQAEIPGVHTKVIEQHKRTIAELALGQPTSGSGWFERRYGFLTNPGMVRFRTLDPALALLDDVNEMALPVADFMRLCPPASRIFVTENLTNYLCLPPARGRNRHLRFRQ